MTLDHWLVFVSMTAVVSFSPGPIMLMCLHNGAHFSWRRQWLGMLGASLGNILLMLLSALEVGALARYWPSAFAVLMLLGAVYLIYLAWRMAGNDYLMDTTKTLINPNTFQIALGIAVSNPKGILYFGALFPPFIQPQQALVPQFLVLTLSFLVIDVIFMWLYAAGGSYMARGLTNPQVMRWFHRSLGALMFLAGVFIAIDPLRSLLTKIHSALISP